MSTAEKLEPKNTAKIVEVAKPIDDASTDVETMPNQVLHAINNVEPVQKQAIFGFDAACKRLSDIIIGGSALIVLSPLLVLIAIIIKLDSTGSALFCQQRRGRNQEVIKVYKFRTMYQSYSTPDPTDASFKQTEKNDSRVTRIGTFLRKASLDELPQLLNVIGGSMSLVGPRPHPIPLDDKYSRIIPTLNSRYAVKPGITGWAQINGFRGETTRVNDMLARIDYDIHYIQHWTLWLDIKIIARTAVKGWVHQNAY